MNFEPIILDCEEQNKVLPLDAPPTSVYTFYMEKSFATAPLAEQIYAAVRTIPRGKVASYSQIAALVGNSNLRRYVGNALHKNPHPSVTPCHRVVNAQGFCSGSFAFGGGDVQREKLEAEGVVFTGGHVDLEKCGISADDFEAMSAEMEKWRKEKLSATMKKNTT